MSRDLTVKVMLSAEEFVAFRAICDEEGQSQSGKARALIKACIHTYAEASSKSPLPSTDETGQD